MRQGIDALRATGAEIERPWLLSALARAYGQTGWATEGLAIVDHTGKRLDESGLYQIKGELLLVRAGTSDQAYAVRPMDDHTQQPPLPSQGGMETVRVG